LNDLIFLRFRDFNNTRLDDISQLADNTFRIYTTKNFDPYIFPTLFFLQAFAKIFNMDDFFSLRGGSYKDVGEFARLDADCFPRHIAFGVSTFRYYLRDARSSSVVAVDPSGLIAGFALGKVYIRGRANIITLDVHPDYRRRGIGYGLLQNLEGLLSASGGATIGLQVAVDNEAAVCLYRRAGYTISSVIPDYYPTSDFMRGVDAYYMYKRLLRED